MLEPSIRQTILSLSARGESLRQISRLLKLSKTTVRKVIKEGSVIPPKSHDEKKAELKIIVRDLFKRCGGNLVRVRELLLQEYSQTIAYSTLTRLVRDDELREPLKRVGHYVFDPGEEMQHDTSPHDVMVGEKKMRLQCAALVLAFSRRVYIQYYPRFTRFEAKTFLSAALKYFDGSCGRCVIDNTSVILNCGSGDDAVISKEMESFSRMYSFYFKAHAIGHADRKAFVERTFDYVEKNFLAGRTFTTLTDLNAQAVTWCKQVDQKEKRAMGTNPATAFIQEKPYLHALPAVLPPIYEVVQRTVDTQGFIHVETQRYSVPERYIGKVMTVYKYSDFIHIFKQHQEIAIHSRLNDKPHRRHVLKGHHLKNEFKKNTDALVLAEQELSANDPLLEQYVSQLKKHVRGRGMRALNRLVYFKRTYPREAFTLAITSALKYGLYDLNRLEALILESVAGVYFNMTEE